MILDWLYRYCADAERCGDWLLHLLTTAAMTPYFFQFDRPNYSRWLPVYLADMYNLPEHHPKVHQESVNGNHSVSRSGNPFSRLLTDMAPEQPTNQDSNTKGEIIGISKEERELQLWFLKNQQQCQQHWKKWVNCKNQITPKPHKEETLTRINQDEQSVQSLLTVFTSELMTDSFNLDDFSDRDTAPLIHLANSGRSS